MPLHRIYAAKGTFSPPEKKAIAQSITNIYNSIPIPAFYTVVVFIDVDEESIFVGGESNARFVIDLIQDAFAPYVRDRGLDWESHVEWVEREFWRENGMRPPLPNTEAEKKWVELNKPVPY
ncbi:hypothetical protein COCSUDRAFT_61117 [Coccomyxa subellipsoidea C-169]|uniref:Tautomerase cis-CaaD-like domain-containing protein n=1 Tax=Coccomyxa subellipsoidea (strain C-169) TaxID=574566 RepID=I0Z654_COCSC|nr:hypothetical protein COCSUDRAFT_61117 [Coccomyxa subellipsoidea C-169]EIE26123.1 hypothetical protein COCSUDRAFT_61117 [Coccomyxa subellipsoidea C-169]|eukprot:XP_005650667.1 hypothetical protein COCSUDRAFT_61117 [Coccomyxa subellipsoidea C-169]